MRSDIDNLNSGGLAVAEICILSFTPPEVALGKGSRRPESEVIAKKWGLLLIKKAPPESAYLKGSYSKGFTMAGFQITSPLRGRKRVCKARDASLTQLSFK